jgi:hypothetical protein
MCSSRSSSWGVYPGWEASVDCSNVTSLSFAKAFACHFTNFHRAECLPWRRASFGHLDLISCRSLLIYLQRTLQQDVAKLFHYALAPEG